MFQAAILLCVSAALATPAQAVGADALPYGDETPDTVQATKYHLGGGMVGIRHLGGTGIGIVGKYGDWGSVGTVFRFGGEALALHTGERRLSPTDAVNGYYAADSARVALIYEEAGMVGFAATGYAVILPTPPSFGLARPGVALGLSAGFMIETDRVGLRSSSVDEYYGTGNSDMDIMFRLYARPQLIVSQGPLSLVVARAFLPVFPTWSVTVLWGW
jgi:hypothetical protein